VLQNEWRKPSYCAGGGNNCLAARSSCGLSHVRESEHPNTILAITPQTLASFIRGAKDGHFDHLI
jgi:Domain of unknown function (DUF397)